MNLWYMYMYMYMYMHIVRNSYVTGARDVWHLLPQSLRAHARGLRSTSAMHPKCA